MLNLPISSFLSQVLKYFCIFYPLLSPWDTPVTFSPLSSDLLPEFDPVMSLHSFPARDPVLDAGHLLGFPTTVKEGYKAVIKHPEEIMKTVKGLQGKA